MSTYAKKIRERRRLVVLVFAARMPETTINLHVLHGALSSLGVPGTLDDLRADVVWLQGEHLVEIELLGEIEMLTLTRRGGEVGLGMNQHAGIARLLPGDLASIQGV